MIIRSDLNASIGNRHSNLNEPDPEEKTIEMSLLGPHGNPSRNKKGEQLLNMLKQIQYRAISTFFDSKHHNTWMHPATKQCYQLDHFLMPKNQLRYVKNAKRKCDSIPSDHEAIYLELCLPNSVHRPKQKRGEEKSNMKIDYNILRAGGASKFKEEIASFVTHLEREFIMQENEQSPDELLNQFQNFITQSAKKIAKRETKNRPDWFSCSEAKLLHHIGI